MKLLIASDIHGNSTSAELLVRHFKEQKCDKMLLLGDSLYFNPKHADDRSFDSRKTAEILNSIKNDIWCVRGNCDSDADLTTLEFPIDPEYKQIQICDHVIFATHGHNIGPYNLPPIGSCDILMCGHTHIAGHAEICDLLYCNPGSASIPKGGTRKSFITFDGTALNWHELESGDIYDSVVLADK